MADGKEYTTDAGGRLTLTVDNTASVELSREGYKTVSPQFSWSGTNTDNEIDIKIKMVPDKSDEKYEISMTMVSTGSGQNKSEIKTVQKEDKEAYLRVDNMPTFGNDGDLNNLPHLCHVQCKIPRRGDEAEDNRQSRRILHDRRVGQAHRRENIADARPTIVAGGNQSRRNRPHGPRASRTERP